jgi:hypothetical protein
MAKIEDGGPIFPAPGYSTSPGMSLRDYFAAMAMQGLLGAGLIASEDAAERSYRMADYMLSERQKKDSTS